jgi:peptidyl-prolyl cis-trans isomerase B (cyclophilin B)
MLRYRLLRPLSASSRLFNHQSAFANRKSTRLLILWLLPLVSCGRYQARDELVRNQSFVEILKREDRRWIGEDGFFDYNLLANPYPEVRQWSAIALGRIACPASLPLLYKALHTGDAAARAASAFAIGEIEDREAIKEEYLDPDPDAVVELVRLLDDRSITVRMRAIEALGRIGSHSEAAAIVRQLEIFHFGGMPAERAYLDASITALARLGDPAVETVLERFADTNDSEIQCRALDALIRIQAKKARPLFAKNLKNPNPEIRSYAARGLGITGDPDLATMLLPLLPPRSGEADTSTPLSVRFSALQSLGELKNPVAIPSIEAALFADPIDHEHPDQITFAIEAAAALGRIGSDAGLSVLLPLLKISGPVGSNAVIALAKILKEDPERFFDLVDPSQFTDPAALPAWTEAMVELGGPDAVEELERNLVKTLKQDGPAKTEVLPLILTALAKAGAPDLQDILAPFLRSRNAALLSAAIAAYRPTPGAKAPWNTIIQAFAASAASGNIQARLEILSHLKPWIHKESVQQLMRSALKDPERSVRLASAALLRKSGVTGIAENTGPSKRTVTDAFCRALAATRKNSTIARLETDRGTIEIELFREDAPFTVANFALMVTGGAYNGMEFELVAPLNLIEGRSPRSMRGGSRTIAGEVNMRPFDRGSVGMARAGVYSETNSFFISLAPLPYRDGIYTCFGRVVSGMQVADRIASGDHIRKISIKETISFQDYQRY